MKKLLLSLLAAAVMVPVSAEQVELNGKQHELEELISRTVGPGITYKRLRSSTYPLNINMIIMDVTNPYNKMQTTTANEGSQGTESLVNQAKRQTTDEMRPIAGANANFWCVSSQEPYSPILNGICYGGHAKNGKMITETNNSSDKWNGGWKHTGIVGISPDRQLYAGHYLYKGYINGPTLPRQRQINQINKLVRDEEIGLYNSFYGSSKAFRPVDQDTDSKGKPCFNIVEGVSTEVLLDIAEGEIWKIGEPMKFIVKEVKPNAGTGALGKHDAALVGRGARATELATLSVGDELMLETNYYYQTTNEAGETVNNPIRLENFVAGNATVMIDGELTGYNTSENYNSQVYSRTGYGASADGKTLYIIVIDKATDGVYGTSAGCPTRVMCEIARHYGCANMVNFDAGGSAMMYLNGQIINKTTEAAPRAVSNGMLCYSIAPKDDKVARLAFDDLNLVAPPYSTYSPRIIAYNQYDDVISYDFHGFTLSCGEDLGECDGETFIAGGNPITAPLTATFEGVSVTRDMTIKDADLSIRIKNLLIDQERSYPIEVTATIDKNLYVYDPARIEWTVEDNSIVNVDNGVLTGLREGTTTVTGKIGDFVDSMNVTVETASSKFMDLTDWEGWQFTLVGNTNASMAADGTINYTYGVNSRTGSSIQINKEAKFYSIPKDIWLTFNSSVAVEKITGDIRTPENTRANVADAIAPQGGFVANKEYTVKFPLDELCDPADMISYPLSLNYLKFTFAKDDALKSTPQTLAIKSIQGEYDAYNGVDNVLSATDKDNTVISMIDGMINVNASANIKSVTLYNVNGQRVVTKLPAGRQTSVNVGNIAPGIYVAKVETSAGVKAVKLVVR